MAQEGDPDPSANSRGGIPPTGEVVIFVSSPRDTEPERQRVERVVQRLNARNAGGVRLKAVLWESEHYSAHAPGQDQIPEAKESHIVIGVLRHRLGTELPPNSAKRMEDGRPYPSGTYYEIVSSINARRLEGKESPDIFVFRSLDGPKAPLDDPAKKEEAETQWSLLQRFIQDWFNDAEGRAIGPLHSFSSPDNFEAQVEALLTKWLEGRARPVTWPVELRGSPFRGLSAFETLHRPVFFGRGRDTERALSLIKDAAARGAPFLLLVGPSGSGKSSLARAGILPELTSIDRLPMPREWRTAVMRPAGNGPRSPIGNGPIGELAKSLFGTPDSRGPSDDGLPLALPELKSGDYRTEAALAALLAHADASATRPIISALDRIGASKRNTGRYDSEVRADLVLLIDQLDELFAGEISEEERRLFARLLRALVVTGRIWVIATLRDELYGRFIAAPELLELKTSGAAYDLAPPGPAELSDIVRLPARAAGLVFELNTATGRALDEVLLEDADQPNMLPLLEFTLDQLFEDGRKRNEPGLARAAGQPDRESDRISLTYAAYERIGRIGGAIDGQAEEALALLGAEERGRLPRLIRMLAEPAKDASGRDLVAIRTVPMDQAAPDEPSGRLVREMVDARILVSEGDPSHTTVRLAHQRVLESWKRAAGIVEENRDFFRVRSNVQAMHADWLVDRDSSRLIPAGRRLAEAEEIADKSADELPGELSRFIATSRQYVARGRRRAFVALGVIAVALAVLTLLSVWKWIESDGRRAEAAALGVEASLQRTEAEAQRDAALRTQSLFLTDLARQRLQSSDYATAIGLALEALPDARLGIDRPYVPDAEVVLHEAVSQLRETVVLRTAEEWTFAEASPDGRRILSGTDDEKVWIWDGVTLAPMALLIGPEDVSSAKFSPDGERVLTAHYSIPYAVLWSASTGAEITRLGGLDGEILAAQFSRDGSQVILTTASSVSLWNAETGAAIDAVYANAGAAFESTAGSSDGRNIAVGTNVGTIVVWNIETRAEMSLFSGFPDEVIYRVSFSPDDRYVVAVTHEAALAWELGTGRLTSSLSVSAPSRMVFFTSDGDVVLTNRTSLNPNDPVSLLTWDYRTNDVLQLGDGMSPLTISPNQLNLIVRYNDTSAMVLAVDGSGPIVTLGEHFDWITAAAFLPEGERVVTSSRDGTLRIWTIAPAQQLFVMYGHSSPVMATAFSPDGSLVLTSADGIRLWNAATGEYVGFLGDESSANSLAAFSREGDRIVGVSPSRGVTIWDVRDRREILTFADSAGASLAMFSPDGARVAIAIGTSARVMDADTGEALASLHGHRETIVAMEFSPDGRRILTTSRDDTARVWDAESGLELVSIQPRDEDRFLSLAQFSPDGRRILLSFAGSVVRVADTETGQQVSCALESGSVKFAVFSPDGRHFATASYIGFANVWEIDGDDIGPLAECATQSVLLDGRKEPNGFLDFGDTMETAAFSPDGRYLAASAADGTVRVWNVVTGARVAVLIGHLGSVSSIAFSADGTRILTGAGGGTARAWQLVPDGEELIDFARAIVPRELTSEQRTQFFLQ